MSKEGLYLGVNLLFNDIGGDINSGDTFDSGDGLGLRGGYGLNRYFAIEAGIWKTKHDLTYGGKTANLKAGTVDLKISFPLSKSYIEPYLLAGVGTYSLEQNGFSEDGTGGRIGIGMDIYLSPELNLNVGLTRSNVTFTHNGSNVNGKITTLDFGFTYHFI